MGESAPKSVTVGEIMTEMPESINVLNTAQEAAAKMADKNVGSLAVLDDSGKGADTVIIAGLHTNICDRHTAYDAFVRGLNIVVAEDGVDALTEQDHVSGLDYMKRVYGAQVRKISEIINKL